MTDPTRPRSRGRHSQPDAGHDVGRPASELLAAWAGADTLQLADGADDTMSPRRRRRYAPETDAAGIRVPLPRSVADVADVGITGLDAAGIADVGLAAAGLDLSVFGIDRPAVSRRTTVAAGRVGSADAPAVPVDPAPRTAEMLVVPPAVPHLGADDRLGRGPAVDRRVAPAPRSPVEPTTADRVAADRFADADTDPGWLSATGRPAPRAAAPADPPPAGPLAALFTDAPATGVQVPRPAAPVDEPATEVYAGPPTGEFLADDEDPAEYAATWASARHRPDDENDEEDESLLEYEDDPDGSVGPATVFDETGGLEVIVAEEDSLPDGHDDGPGDGGAGGDGRRGGGRGSGRSRRRRGPVTVVLSLVVLAALVVGIVAGGQTLWRTINPLAADYSGSGTGAVQVRVNEGDSLRTIAGTLVESDVIASSKPFEKAAKANPAATGIQPGVYSLHQQMSGKAALDLLLDPVSRVVSKVTLPEGLTVAQTLQRLADQGGLPLDQLQAAAADPAALGLPPYANGLLEGFLFPATYDIEPDDTPVSVLTEMVAGTVRVLDKLQIPEAQRLGVVTEASVVQAEAGSVEDMGKVARVLDNRLADGMPLQLDTTVNYANGKSGLTTTAQDRANPSPYNTYMHPGLPPGAISNPGEEALTAVLHPTPGDWRFFVVVDPDTGETRFAVTAAEHNQNVLLFQQWLQDHPGN